MSKTCFVISPIGEPNTPVRRHADAVFKYIVTPALADCGIAPVRADQLHEPGIITDQMFRAIADSDLCVAVLTGHNPNVFYELAVAQALGRPVVILLERDQRLPFDVQHLRCVPYDLSPENLMERVSVRELADQVRCVERLGWCVPSPLDPYLRPPAAADDCPARALPDGGGFEVRHGDLAVRTLVGAIQHCEVDDECLVALPANEYFDDDCIHDRRSALGAYMQHHHGDRIAAVQQLVRDRLAGRPTIQVEKKKGEVAASYGVGTCAYLGRPPGAAAHVVLVAVTTQRAWEGLRTTPAVVQDALAAVVQVLADERLTRLFVPLLGSGHGGLRPRVSLHTMLTALAHLHAQPAGRHLREVNLVVHRSTPPKPADVPDAVLRAALRVTTDLFAP